MFYSVYLQIQIFFNTIVGTNTIPSLTVSSCSLALWCDIFGNMDSSEPCVITRQICSQSDPISGPSLAWHVGHDAVMLSLWHDDMTTWQSETLLWTDNIQWLSHRELPGPGCHCTHCTLGKHGPRVGQINQSTRSLGQIKQSHLNWNIIWQINIPLLLTELSLNPTLTPELFIVNGQLLSLETRGPPLVSSLWP